MRLGRWRWESTQIHTKINQKQTVISLLVTSEFLLFSLFQQWHAFSVPELQNFLVILEKEEAERMRAVQQKYAVYRQKLQQALQQHDPWPLTCPLTTSTQGETEPLIPTPHDPIQRVNAERNLSPPSTTEHKRTVPVHTSHTDPFSGHIQVPPLPMHPLLEHTVETESNA